MAEANQEIAEWQVAPDPGGVSQADLFNAISNQVKSNDFAHEARAALLALDQ